MTTLYVSNLNYKITEKDLRSIFSKYGRVLNAKLIIDFKLKQSKGYAFIKMKDAQSAHLAVSKLHLKQLDGRTLKVVIADEREPAETDLKRSRVVKVGAKSKEEPKKEVSKVRRRDRKGGLKTLFNYLGK